MKKVQSILIVIAVILLFAGFFTSGWLAVGLSAGAAVAAVAGIILPNFTKKKK